MFQNQNKRKEDNHFVFISNQDSVYYIEILSRQNNDFKLIKKSFHNTSRLTESSIKIKRIWRVHRNKIGNPEDNGQQKMLLVHGTHRTNVPGILHNGFIRPSIDGSFGPGVYHSEYFFKCMPYARSYNNSYFFFINEIPIKHITVKHEYDVTAALPEFYCHEYLFGPRQLERDSSGSLINVTEENVKPEYVASTNIVTPKYLVHAQEVIKKLVKTLFNMPLILCLNKIGVFFLQNTPTN